jgi:hypothetical protein
MLIYLLIVLNNFLLVVLEGIEGVKEGEHGLGKVLGF